MRAWPHAFGGEILADDGGIVGGIGVDVDGAAVGLVDGDDGLPLHFSAGVDLVGEGGFADQRVARVDDDVGVEVALFGEGTEVMEVDAEVEPAVCAAVAEAEGDDVAGAVEAVVGFVDVGALVVGAVAVVFIEGEEVIACPVGEFVLVGSVADGAVVSRADDDGVARRQDKVVVLQWPGAVGEFGGVVEAIHVGITLSTVAAARAAGLLGGVDVGGRIVRPGGGEVVGAVVQGIESIGGFPAVGQSVAVAVGVERVGFFPGFSGVVLAIAVRVSVDDSVEVGIFAESVAQFVAVGVGVVGVGLGPGFAGLADGIGPGALQPGVEGGRYGGSVAVDPAVAVGVLDAVEETVVVRVGVGRVGDGSGDEPGAVASVAPAVDSGHAAEVVERVVEGRVEVADEVVEPVAVGVGT